MKNNFLLIVPCLTITFVVGCSEITTKDKPKNNGNQSDKLYSTENLEKVNDEDNEKVVEEDWIWYDSNDVKKSDCKYNDIGNEIERIWRNTEGKIRRKETYAYNEHDSLIEKTEFSFKDSAFNSKYDDKGNTIEYSSYYNGIIHVNKKFDSLGKIEENINYDYTGKIRNRSTYRYTFDDNGNKLEESFSYSGANNEIYKKGIVKYNNQGDIMTKASYKPNGEVINLKKYDNNNNNNLIEKITSNIFDEFEAKEIYKYNLDGSLIETIWYDIEGSIIKRKVRSQSSEYYEELGLN